MATTPNACPTPGDDRDHPEETAQRIRALNEQLLQNYRDVGSIALDAYERTLETIVEFEAKAVSTNQLGWVAALAQAHSEFVRATSAAQLQLLRELLD